MKSRINATLPNAARESLLAAAHSFTVRDIIIAVERICMPKGNAWKKPLRKFLAELLFGPLYVDTPFTRERINVLLREVQLLAAHVNPTPKRVARLKRDSTKQPNRLED